LASRIASGEFTVSQPRTDILQNMRRLLGYAGPPGRALALQLANFEAQRRAAQAEKMPESRGDVGAIVGEPFFLPLYKLFKIYGGVFRLTFGPKSFVIVSDPLVAKHILKDNAKGYSKGILAEILEFVMGTGLIPADGQVWRVRRRAIVPAVHRKYVATMMGLFGRATQRLCDKLDEAAASKVDVEMESLFSRLTLDVIGKAVFNYEFDSLTNDTGIVEAVYVTLREAEDRSTAILPYWKIPILRAIVPRQQRVTKALNLINEILDTLIATCKRMVEEEDVQFEDEYMNDRDPSILHFLLAAGDEVSSKQLRDDLMTMLIAGHETSAAVLTWTFYLLAQNPGVVTKLQEEVDRVLADRAPTVEDMKDLRYTTRVINESLRLYPQPPVLIRRSLDSDMLGKFRISKGEDIFISTWNIHRSPKLWEHPESFMPERWPLDGADPTEVNQDYRYLPFGGGPRKCLGDMFATFEVVTALAMLVRRFDFSIAPGAPPVEMTTGATIHTSAGLLMSVNRRRTVRSDIAEVSGGFMNGISRASKIVDDKNIPIVVSP
jgi:beta-ring hydroxylase